MIKAIETSYNGYRFRSRLEARWAIFFDALGIEWEYEPEGYRLSDGSMYLPDFWLPQANFHAEVKPSIDNISEKLSIFDRNPPEDSFGLIFLIGPPKLWESDPYFPYIPVGSSSTWHVVCRCVPGRTKAEIEKAVNNARAARFEHGETP